MKLLLLLYLTLLPILAQVVLAVQHELCAELGGICQAMSLTCEGSIMSTETCPDVSNPNMICCKKLAAPDPEFRAFFIATVDNIDWPLTRNETSENQQSQMIDLLDTAQEMNFNAIVLQIRPAFDSFYPSFLEPWSKWLTGTQGQAPDPMYDPLQFAIDQAHDRGLQVHVWMNPYRGGLQTNYDGLDGSHACSTMRQYCYVYDNFLWLDPGVKVVEDHLIEVVRDVASRYEIDGLHFDDYFYPYPSANQDPFPDDATYSAYLAQGGQLQLNDWRRDNVNRMVQRVYTTLHQIRPTCILSISPPGTYRPGHPDGGMPSPPISGFDPYEGMFADTKLWLQSGWVDFFAPQLYWRIDPPAQSYPTLLDWWLEQNILRRNIYVANGAYRVFTDNWPVSEITNQVNLTRDDTRRSMGCLGNIHFSAKYFRDNFAGIKDAFKEIYPTPATIPPYPWLGNGVVPKKMSVADVGEGKIEVRFDDEDVHTWVVHRVVGEKLVMVKMLPKYKKVVEVGKGRFSVRGVNRVSEMGTPSFVDVV